MKAIVIIEDKREELLAAITAVKERLGVASKQGLGIEVDGLFGEKSWKMGFEVVGHTIVYANHLAGAEEAIRFAREDPLVKMMSPEGVFILTDLMFPLHQGGKEQANGISVILDAVEAGIPVTVCSDTDHHEVGFLPKLCRHLEAKNPGAKINLVLDKKDWKRAVDLLIPHAEPQSDSVK
jgi:hypothetical protein